MIVDASTGECLVFTEKEGLLSAVAHDLQIRVERFQIRVEGASVEAEFEADSLRVVGPGVLSAKDRAEIESNIAGKVLRAKEHPSIRFRSTSVKAEKDGFHIEGVLSIRGRDWPLSTVVRKEGDRAIAECTVHQPDFGIQPFSAVFGTLRVKADVTVRVTAPWTAVPG